MTAKNIRNLNKWIRRECLAYTIWMGDRLINSIKYGWSDHMDAWLCIEEMMHSPHLSEGKTFFVNARAVMNKLDESETGVVTFGVCGKHVATIIRHSAHE